MSTLEIGLAAGEEIRSLARRAAAALVPGSPAWQAASGAAFTPVSYMRYAEFDALLRGLGPLAGDRVLDVGSPQWLSVLLAARHPDTSIVYINILEAEVAPFREIAAALGLANLAHALGDVRNLAFPDGDFSKVISVSAIEHVFPEVGGDLSALKELRRVLRASGAIHLTVPCKDRFNVISIDRPVYEREGPGTNFYAREYDLPAFRALSAESALRIDGLVLIAERAGVAALDSQDWGPSRGSTWSRVARQLRRVVRKLGVSIDAWAARRYLRASESADGRLVNIYARLAKP